MFSRSKIATLVAEVFGTGILTMVALSVSRSPIGLPYFVSLAAGLTLSMLVLTVGATSGAHVNPAVTLGLWTVRKVDTLKAISYIVAQFVGAALAWKLYVYLINSPVKSIAGAEFDWRVFVAEMVGALVFTFGVAAAIYQKYEGGKLAAAIGGSLMLGVLVASSVSNGIVNPAVALGMQSWSKAYAFGPLLGGLVGVNLYALLFAERSAVVVSARSTTTTKAVKAKKTTSAPRKVAAKKTTRKRK